MRTVYAQQADTVDAIAWRYTGQTQGVVECILLANPGLAEFGPLLPLGTVVRLPDVPASGSTPTSTQTLINLWD